MKKSISNTMYSSSSSSTISSHRLRKQPWLFSLCLFIFHLTILSCSSTSTTHHHNHDEERGREGEREREMGIWDYMNSATDKLKRNALDLTVVKRAGRSTYDYSWSAVTKIDNAVRGYAPDVTAVKHVCRSTYDNSWSAVTKIDNAVRVYAPDVTAVKHVCRSTYDYSWSAVTKIDNAVRVCAPDVTAVKHVCRSTYDYSWSAVTKIDNAVRVTVVHKLNNIYLPDEKARSEIVRFANSFAKNAAIFTFHESLKAVPGGSLIYRITSQTMRDYSKSEDCKDEIKALQAEIIQLKKEFMSCKKSIEQSEICNRGVESESQNAVHLDSNLYKKPYSKM